MTRTKTERRIKVAELKGWTFNGPDRCPDGWGYAPDVGPTSFPQRLPDYEGDATLWAAMYQELIGAGFLIETERFGDSIRISCIHTTHDTFFEGHYESLAIAVIEAWIAWKDIA